jgi:hypothetical protein
MCVLRNSLAQSIENQWKNLDYPKKIHVVGDPRKRIVSAAVVYLIYLDELDWEFHRRGH